MPTDIATQLAAAVERLHAPTDLADRVMRRSRSLRRRRLAGVSLLATAAIVVAVVVPLATSTNSSGVSRLVPATPAPTTSPAPVLASVAGVDVTWLPTGFNALPYSPNYGSITGMNGAVQRIFQSSVNGRVVGRLSVAVQRGSDLNLDTFAKDNVVTGGTLKRGTVRGHPAILLATTSGTEATLLWVEKPGLTIGVFGLTSPELMHVADGLVIHPAPAPAGSVADAVIQIRATFQYAYTGTEPAATKLAAIENGAKLAPVLAEITRQLPDTVRTTKITTGTVTFLDPNQALVDYTLTFQYQGGPVSQTGQATAVVVGGAWRVSESSYCNSIQRPGVTLTCPPK